ncbi:MAG: hypothetical protein SFX72_22210 [Isosphaeraceae bacterium]|nr:hypothetical protein [Isosphaeraceae bacterium]
MPALHRMPIFYIVLAFATLCAWLVLRPRTDPVRAIDPPPPSPSSPAESPRIDRKAVPEVLESGLRRKVMLGPQGARLDSDAGDSTTLEPNAILFRFGEDARGVLVGRSRDPEGRVDPNALLEWNSRLTAFPTPSFGRPLIQIFGERQCLEASILARGCELHAATCPTLASENDHSAFPTAASIGWPILDSAQLSNPTGESALLLRIAPFLGANESERENRRAGPATIEIGFVVDSTESMKRPVELLRDQLPARLAAIRATHPDVNLRFGLISFRDRASHLEYASKRIGDLGSPEASMFAQLRAADRPDGSVAEAVADAVASALPQGSEAFSWSPGSRTRILLLVGDAPDHDERLYRVGSIAALAARERISIATVSIRSSLITAAESNRRRAQWSTLSEESYRPFPGSSRRLAVEVDRPEDLTNEIAELIEGSIRNASETDASARAKSAVGEPRRDDRRSGWISSRKGGAELIEFRAALSRVELDALLAVDETVADRESLEQLRDALIAGELDFLAVDRAEGDSAAFAARRRLASSLPISRASTDGSNRRDRLMRIRADMERDPARRRIGVPLELLSAP